MNPSAKRPTYAKSAHKQSSKKSNNLPIIGVAVGIAAALVVAVIVIAQSGEADSPTDTAEYGVVDVSGEALAPFSGDGVDPAVGSAAPVLAGEDFVGETVSAGDAGMPELVVFLAHWCPHCNAEAPRLKAYLDEAGVPDDVRITLVPTGSTPTRDYWPPSQWIDDMGLADVPTLVDDEDATAAAAYGLDGFPYIVALDGDGKVVARVSGEQPEGFFAQTIDMLRAA